MNNTSKSKSKKSDKSPKTQPSYSDSVIKGNTSGNTSSSDSTQGPLTPTPISKLAPPNLITTTVTVTPSSDNVISTISQLKKESSLSDSQEGATLGGLTMMVTAAPMQVSAPALMSPTSVKPSPTLWFTTEIQQMMYGFGDCRKPLAESAGLVEEVVHQQMVHLLYEAEEVGRMRNARFLGIEDFLFLLRKNKTKLQRLLRYMTLKDVKVCTVKTASLEEEENVDQASEIKQPPKKRRKICYDFLSAIDQTGELVALFDDDTTDEVKHERVLRAELQSRSMDSYQYMEYCEARQASFTPRYKMQKFKDWLMAGINLDIKPNPLAMEVLGYMAYETVAQVVDLALLVKQDQRASTYDPLSLTMPAVCINHDTPPTPQNTEGLLTTVSAALKSPTQGSKSPTSSPPATPTTPSSLGPSNSLSQSSLSLSSSASKSKSKKKKKSSSAASRDVFTAQAITPGDIREAMRRYGQCVGPFADFSKCPLLNPSSNLLCC